MIFIGIICTFAIIVASIGCQFVIGADPLALDQLNSSSYEIIKLRGYNAENHYLTTPDNHIINIVQATNPLINGGKTGTAPKDPVLFLHGILTNSSEFIIDSFNAKPKNYAKLQAGRMSIKCLEKLLLDDPATKSLVFTLLNFGHEVWLMNERGTSASQGFVDPKKNKLKKDKNRIKNVANKVSGKLSLGKRNKRDVSKDLKNTIDGLKGGLKDSLIGGLNETFTHFLDPRNLLMVDNTSNPHHWNYSIDEIVKYDFPMAIDYVLNKTGRTKLSLVSHSLGGAITLMSLADNPSLSKKINKNLLWAPAFKSNANNNFIGPGVLGLPILMDSFGPFPPVGVLPAVHGLIATSCVPLNAIGCEAGFDFFFGPSANQQIIKPGIQGAILDSTATHVYAHLAQAAKKGTMYKYDYGKASLNMKAYGQSKPPKYDLSKITLKNMSFWAGGTDVVITVDDVSETVKNLTVPAQLNIVNQTGVAFNHLGFHTQKDIAKLVKIPGLKYLES